MASKPTIGHLCVAGVLLMVMTSCSSDSVSPPAHVPQTDKYKAAVYEHAVVLPDMSQPFTRPQALAAMTKNLEIYRRVLFS